MWGSTPELMGGGRCRMLRLRGVRSAVGLGIGAGVEGRRCCPLASAGMKHSLPAGRFPERSKSKKACQTQRLVLRVDLLPGCGMWIYFPGHVTSITPGVCRALGAGWVKSPLTQMDRRAGPTGRTGGT